MAKKIFFILLPAAAIILYQNGASRPVALRPNTALAMSGQSVVINEIGAYETSGYEWIELYNYGSSTTNLQGWKLAEGFTASQPNGINHRLKEYNGGGYEIAADGFAVIAQKADQFKEKHPAYSGLLLDSSWGSLKEAGERLLLKDDDGIVVEDFTYLPCPHHSLERSNPALTDYTAANWQEHKNGNTVGSPNSNYAPAEVSPSGEEECGNGILDENEECDDGNNEDSDGCNGQCLLEEAPENQSTSTENSAKENKTSGGQGEEKQKKYYRPGEVVVNEFVSDPADGETEWIELYNTGEENIDLDGWSIEEGSGAKTAIKGNIGTKEASKFFIVEKPKGNLNNRGDIIILRDNYGVMIDKVAYGNWNDGNLNDNAPGASDPEAVARKFDGLNSFNNAADFAVTSAPSKGSGNLILSENGIGQSDEKKEQYGGYAYSIIISEILPNPFGRDDQKEFIELYNKGKRDIDLSEWILEDESGQKYKIGGKEHPAGKEGAGWPKKRKTTVKAGDFYLIYRKESNLALNNGGDILQLWPPNENRPVQTIRYEKAEEGRSFVNTGIIKEEKSATVSKEWVWSKTATPGKINIISAVNHPPLVAFDCPEKIISGIPAIFDGSDTVDEDGDKLFFHWNFGDGITIQLPSPQHTYLQAGNYALKLTVSDGKKSAKKEKIITVINSSGQEKNNQSKTSEPLVLGWQGTTGSLIINELMPDPAGSDQENEWIELFNNGRQKINLLGWRIDDGEGGSRPHNFTREFWLETGQYYVVGREESKIALNNSGDEARLFDGRGDLVDSVKYIKAERGISYARGLNNKWFWTKNPTPGEKNKITVPNNLKLAADSNNYKVDLSRNNRQQNENSPDRQIIITTTPDKISEFDVGDLVRVRGRVAVLPGILGQQYFYIIGNGGVQVYNYKKNFPALQIGDLVEASGRLSAASGETRLKTERANDIVVIEHGEAPVPETTTCEQIISEDDNGRLVSVTGEVVEVKGASIYLDDNTGEIKIYTRKATGINPRNIKEGEMISATGIVSRTAAGARLMPRSINDIIKKDAESWQTGRVLGEVAASDNWPIAARNKKMEIFQYLLITAGTIITILSILLIKNNRKNPLA